MPGCIDRDQEIRDSAMTLVSMVANKYNLQCLADFKCPHMRRLAELVDLKFVNCAWTVTLPTNLWTVVTNFDSLKVGDRIRRTRKDGRVTVGTIKEHRWEPDDSTWGQYHVLDVEIGDYCDNCLDIAHVRDGWVEIQVVAPEDRVPAAPYKPAVKNGRWQAKPGDMFRHKSGSYADITVVGTDSFGSYVSSMGPKFRLLEQNWDYIPPAPSVTTATSTVAPTARKPYVKDGQWIAEVGDKFKLPGKWADGSKTAIVKEVDAKTGKRNLYRLTNEFGQDQGRGWLLSGDTWGPVTTPDPPAARKPYVKDGQWIAEVGDKFEWLTAGWVDGSTRAIVKEVDVKVGCRNDYSLIDEFGRDQGDGWCLDERNWEPITTPDQAPAPRKPYVKNGRWVCERGDRMRWIGGVAVFQPGDRVTVTVSPNTFCGDTRVMSTNGSEQVTGMLSCNWEPVS